MERFRIEDLESDANFKNVGHWQARIMNSKQKDKQHRPEAFSPNTSSERQASSLQAQLHYTDDAFEAGFGPEDAVHRRAAAERDRKLRGL